MIDHIIETALLYCTRIVLVAGYRGEELKQFVGNRERVEVVMHREWQQGMFSSIRAGAARIETERFFICLADLPLLRGEIFDSLIAQPEADVLVPSFAGKRGHPVLLHRRVADIIAATAPRTGAMRDIIGKFELREFEWYDDSVLKDTDTREEYERILLDSAAEGDL